MAGPGFWCYIYVVCVLYPVFVWPCLLVCGEQVALVEVFLQEPEGVSSVLQGEVVEGSLDNDLPVNQHKRDYTLEGDLILMQNEAREVDDNDRQVSPWIGVVSVNAEDRKTAKGKQESFASAVVSKMKRALVLGASALIILALNQNTVREMDLSQVLSKPIIVIQTSENVTKLIGALLRGLQATAKISYKTFLQDNLGATLTLWSSCGRSRGGLYGEWQGVICTGESNSQVQKYLQQLWNTIVLVALILSTGVIVQARWQYQDNQFNDDSQLHVKQDIMNRLSALQTRTYRQAKTADTDDCAVCLEQFNNNQCLRVLPCLHEFHRDCVDPWLLLQQTCPLCKRSVLGNFC
ncbi:RING finger protein 215 [Chanos chanos]|uniref:RING-type E3 ubiquitin transferase n=1 Tax=Chanos chanos TaxID=29144 RepID=A0A6J2WTK8_CHACN|nr:RING finger protein 215 [Chanos chanos]